MPTHLAAVVVTALIATQSAAQQPTAFVNVNVVPMDSERVLPAQTVVIRDGRIAAMGARGQTPVPADGRVVDGRGAYLMPGLADMHVHLLADSNELALHVANGVTTVRDLAGEPLYFEWRHEIAMGRRTGPNLIISSPLIDSPRDHHRGMAWPWAVTAGIAAVLFLAARPLTRRIRRTRRRRWLIAAGVAVAIAIGWGIAHTVVPFPDRLLPRQHVPHLWVGSRREAASVVRAAAGRYDLVKLYGRLPAAHFTAAVRAARQAGIHTAAHVPTEMGLTRTLRSGLDELAHVYFLVLELQASTDTLSALTADQRDAAWHARLREVAAEVRRAGVDVTSTLAALPELLEQETDSAMFLARHDMQYRTPAARRAIQNRLRGAVPPIGEDLREHIAWGSHAVRELVRAGVPLVLGTDESPRVSIAGFAAHEELKLLVASGLSPWETLRAATVNASRVAGGSAQWGTIAVGMRADLLLADGNPLLDVAAIRRPRGVMVAGRWYDRAALDSLLATVVRRRTGS